MGWYKLWPPTDGTGTSAVSGSTEQLRDNWAAMEAIIGIAHESMCCATSGDHLPGKVGFVAYCPSGSLGTSPGTGSLAATTDTGEFLIYLPTGEWDPLTSTYWSRIRKMRHGAQEIPPSYWQKIYLTTESSGSYDSLSEFSMTLSRWTCKSPGYYQVRGSVRYPATSLNYLKIASIYKNSVAVTNGCYYGSCVKSIQVQDILYLAADDKIELYTYQSSGSAVNIVGAGLNIQRLS